MTAGKDKSAAIAVCYSSIVEGKPLAEAIFDYEAFMKTKVTEAEKPVKTENGKAFPKTAFAYTPSDNPGSWKLRLYADPGDDAPDTRIVGAAVAALGKGFRGSKVEIPEGDLPGVKAKVKAAWKKANPDAKDEELPEVLKEYGGDMPVANFANFVPWGITSFADLEAHQAAQESAHEIGELTGQFQSLVGNIMGSPDITNKAQAVSTLTTEFIQKVTSITGEVTMEAETTTTAEVGKRVKSEMKSRLHEIKKQLDELMSWADYDDTDDPNSALEKPSAHKESEPVQVIEFAESESGAAISIAEDDAPPTVNDRRSPLKVVIRLIEPGFGNLQDNNYYSAEVLKRDAHLFEGVKMYPTDHRQEQKSADKEVAVIEKSPYGFSDTGAPLALVNIFDPDFAEKTRNRADAGHLDTLKNSILAKGTARPGTVSGRKGNIVEAITEANSVDFVTRAGAGGQALNLAESKKEDATMTLPDEKQAPIAETETTTSPVATTTVTISEGAPASVDTPAPVSVDTRILAEADVNTLLSASTLPDEFKEIMRERQYKDQAEFMAYQTKMIERAKKLTGSGQPFGLGAPGSDRPKQVDPVKLAEVQDRVNAKYFGGK